MLTRLTLQNFYSVRDHLDIDLALPGSVPDDPDRFGPLFPGSDVRAPKVVALYGPNAAGKSTILRALSFLSNFIEHGFQLSPRDKIFCHRFNNDPYRIGEMRFSIEFGGPSDLTGSEEQCPYCRYAYDLVLHEGETDQPETIKHESLSYWPPETGRRVRVFEREGNNITSGSRGFRLQGYTRPLARVLRSNVSLISTLVQLGHEPSIWLRDFVSRIKSNMETLEIMEFYESYIVRDYFNDEKLLAAINQEIQRLDLGITEIIVEKSGSSDQNPRAYFVHSGLSSSLPLARESHGTRQFFRIFPTISRALQTGGIAVVDELDTSIHPLLLPEIVQWFYNKERNPKDAQIWFTCQNPHLLAELSKDEIFLCEKDSTGCTTAFGLSSIKNVRRLDNYAKKYLGGVYGAVPHIG